MDDSALIAFDDSSDPVGLAALFWRESDDDDSAASAAWPFVGERESEEALRLAAARVPAAAEEDGVELSFDSSSSKVRATQRRAARRGRAQLLLALLLSCAAPCVSVLLALFLLCLFVYSSVVIGCAHSCAF